ncbi:MAG: FAD-dependent oxidoreductase [bacterium]|nr:FAD-dependent oxidoreductase [bacterium]
MIKFRIHGRGGQGGVTLAKILSFMYWTEGKWVQAFGDYSAERTGAPLLAFTLIDDIEITNRSKIYYPDHLIIVDNTLLGPNVLSGLKEDGKLLIDTPEDPEVFQDYPGRIVATLDAKKLARKYKLGTKTTPITNTALAGAFAKVFGLKMESVEKTIKALGFPETNTEAAKEAYSEVKIGDVISGEPKMMEVPVPTDKIPPLITGNLGAEPKLNTGDWKSEEPYFSKAHIPPCNFYCPAGNDIQAFITEMAQNNYDKALEVLYRTTPLPGTTGRVCPHPCEDKCNRTAVDERVNIHELERYAADKGHFEPPLPEQNFDEKVAIIGSGPAGISAAYHLRLKGYEVTIFEADAEPGGMLRYGIPKYRSPKDILDKEIKVLTDMGVEIKCNNKITGDNFQTILNEYDAMIVAIGLSHGNKLDLDGSNNATVFQGVDFLHQVSEDKEVNIGSDVIVIGGGNTAIDASRTALRMGSENVTIVYRRERKEMPAIAEEIEAALEEGVELKFLYSPDRIISENGNSMLVAQRMKLGDPGDDGRRKPVPVEGEYENIKFSSLILATGQHADLGFLNKEIVNDWGFIKANKVGATEISKIFAAGDIASNEGTVTHAIGYGRKTADSVHSFLKNVPIPDHELNPEQVITEQQLSLYYFKPSERNNTNERPVKERISDFEEVNLGIDGVNEALRCLSCGVCNGCITSGGISKCHLFCPERTIEKVNATELKINYEGCKGCLICMEVCPRDGFDKRTAKIKE